MRFRFVLSEIGIGLRRNLAMTISLVLVTFVSLLLVGIGILAQRQVSETKDYWYDRVQVSLFLCTQDSESANCPDGEVTQAQKSDIEAQLRSAQLAPYVEKVYYETKQEAYDRFRQQFSDSVLSENVTVDQMPESFRVKLKDAEQYQVVAQLFRDRAGVEQVVDQDQVVKRLFALMNGLKWSAWVVAGVTLLASILLVAVTIRLTAFTRRRETAIMRLVGASNFLIRLPFLLESLFAAAIGALVASAALTGFTRVLVTGWLKRNMPIVGTGHWVETSDAVAILPWLFLIGLAVSGVSSYLAVNRYLKV